MSNFICSECGMTNIDCGRDGYKTPKEIELEKKVHILNKANMKLENELGHFADLSKKVEHLQKQLRIAIKALDNCRGFDFVKQGLKEIEEVKMNIKHIQRKDGENDIKLRSRIKKEHQIADLSKKVERLQAQLNEARDVIKLYAKSTIGHKQNDGTYAFHCVSGEIDWLNPLNSRTYMQTTVYDPKPAKKWLKKWGVK